jgi:hypothetical protein
MYTVSFKSTCKKASCTSSCLSDQILLTANERTSLIVVRRITGLKVST